MIPGLTQEIKEAIDTGDQTRAGQLMSELDSIRHLSTQVLLAAPQSQPTTQPVPSSAIPAGALIIANPKTGERQFSTDGGKTWNKIAQTQAPASNPNDSMGSVIGHAVVGGLKKLGDKFGPMPTDDQDLFNYAASNK